MQSYSFSFYTSSIKSRDHVSQVISIDTFLKWVRDGKYSKQIQAVRKATGNKQDDLKNALPYCTLSGIFAPGKRDAKSLEQHSGLIQIDIDKKGQLAFDPALTKTYFKSDEYILSAFLSPRGTGLKAIVKIDPTKHKESFLELEKYFKEKYYIIIDAACKDVCRPFYVSFDADLYYNPKSKKFPIQQPNQSDNKAGGFPIEETDLNKKTKDIEALCSELENRKVDITNRNGYSEWRDIGFAISNGLGEVGRQYFKRISALASNYDEGLADKQYSACCQNFNGGRKWESLFGIAKDFNIIISNNGKPGRTSNINTAAISPQDENQKKAASNKNLPLIVQVENFLNERYEFRKNNVNEKIEYRNKNGDPTTWLEANENEISRLLEHNYFKFSPSKTASLLNSDFVKPFNPIIEYFNSLKYTPSNVSYIDQLCAKIKAKDQERFNRHFKKMLVRCVACSAVREITNNNFNKHVFVLINREQTIGKSSFCRWLCPPALKEYFVENITMDKDGLIALATSFIINLDELASLSRYDINQLKAKISMASINERLPYGRRRQFYPRRANFFGSTNNDEFLNDDTGNARWLCFEIEKFEPGFWLPGSPNYVDIDNVWSEAKFLFDAGFEYQLTMKERNENETVNRSYEERSMEEEMIANSFDIDLNKNDENFITTTDVLNYLVIAKSVNPNKLTLKKIGSVIKKLGFIQGTMRKGSFPVKGYYMQKLQ